MTNTNVDEMRVHNETWAQQLKDAMNVNGGDIENATTVDYVMHFLTFGFKVGTRSFLDPKYTSGGPRNFYFKNLAATRCSSCKMQRLLLPAKNSNSLKSNISPLF